MSRYGALGPSTFLDFVNAALHVEILLADIVVFAIENFLEATNGFGHRHLLAGASGEHFSHAERLAQKALNLAGAEYGQLVICLLYTSPSPRDRQKSRMPSSA